MMKTVHIKLYFQKFIEFKSKQQQIDDIKEDILNAVQKSEELTKENNILNKSKINILGKLRYLRNASLRLSQKFSVDFDDEDFNN